VVSTGWIEVVGWSMSSLLFENFRKSVVFKCKENGIVLAAISISFLEPATCSDLELVLGTITGITSALFKTGTLTAEWTFIELLFGAAVLGTVIGPVMVAFNPVFKLAL
jgi:hypothetical protein